MPRPACVLPAVVLVFGLAGCQTPGSPHPTYLPVSTLPPVTVSATPEPTAPAVELVDPTTAPAPAAPATENPRQSRRTAGSYATTVAAPVVVRPVPVRLPVNHTVPRDLPTPPTTAAPTAAPTVVPTTVAVLAPVTLPAEHGPYIDNILAVQGRICPNTYLTGRTADGQPMRCTFHGEGTSPTWEPL